MSEQPHDQVVYEFEAGRRTFRASISRFRGEVYADLREWYETAPGQELLPTKKGVCIPLAYIDELREAVDALAAAPTARVAGRATERVRA